MKTRTDEIIGALSRAALGGADKDTILRLAVKLVHESSPKYNWTGIYLLQDNELYLHNFIGAPTPHARIPISQGICGAAARAAQTVIVPDVNADPRYLACSLETKSEIVVPIIKESKVLGEIDIDSHTPDAFGPEDRELLEAVAEALARCL